LSIINAKIFHLINNNPPERKSLETELNNLTSFY